MSNDSVSSQEPAWPKPNEKQLLQVFEQSCQNLCGLAKRRAGRPAMASWSHLCLAIMLCFLRGWNAQLEVWRLIGSERLGCFAPVKVSDQAIYNRIERAAIPLQWLFDHVSAWLQARLARLSRIVTLPHGPPQSTPPMPVRLIECRAFCPGYAHWHKEMRAYSRARSVPCLMCVCSNGCVS